MPPPPEEDPLFRLHYADARNRLVTGDFAGAATEFQAALRFAVTPTDRALAEAQETLSREWASRGLALVERSRVSDEATARAVDLRTGDEIVSLYTNAVFYGIGTGVWVDEVANAGGSTKIVIAPLLLAGAAAGGVAISDHGRGLRYGVAQSIVSGMYIGLEEGIAWSLFAATSPSSSTSGSTDASIVWGSTTGGIVAGAILSAAVPTTPGRSSYVGSTALWGGVVAGMTVGGLSGDSSGRAPLFASGVGVSAGALVGLLTAGSVSPSIAHVRFLDLGGIGGMLVGGGIYLAIANDNVNAQALAGTAALGTAAGLATVWYLTRNMPRDELSTHEAPSPSGVVWNPTVIPAKGGGMIGVVGVL